MVCDDNKHSKNACGFDLLRHDYVSKHIQSMCLFYYATITSRKSMTALTVLSLHLLDLLHIGVVLLPVRGRRVVHVCRARHGGLSPATLRNFLHKRFQLRDKSSMPTRGHLTSSKTLYLPLTPGDCSL